MAFDNMQFHVVLFTQEEKVMKIEFLKAFGFAFGILYFAAIAAVEMGLNPFWIQQGLIAIVVVFFGILALVVNGLIEATESEKDTLIGLTMAVYLTGGILSLPFMALPEAKIFLIEGPIVAMAIIFLTHLYARSRNGLKKALARG